MLSKFSQLFLVWWSGSKVCKMRVVGNDTEQVGEMEHSTVVRSTGSSRLLGFEF